MGKIWELFQTGGFVMYPLVIFSFLVWGVIIERLWYFRKLKIELKAFHLDALNALLRKDSQQLKRVCENNLRVPTAHLVSVALERLNSKDPKLKDNWLVAVERERSMVNLHQRRYLWILGTIGSASPFVGLFGTVVGILRSFQTMADAGKGGFAVVAAGISEALVATAAGIVVAVIAVMAYNAFQVRVQAFILTIKVQIEELLEVMVPDGN